MDDRLLGVLKDVLPGYVAHAAHNVDAPTPALLAAELEALVRTRTSAARQRTLRAGRAAARDALKVLGEPPTPILQGGNREPLWPDGIVGSITHAGGHAAAAVAHRTMSEGIGIDLEDGSRYFRGLEGYIAFDEESDRLGRLEGAALSRATLELFSAKEAIYKAFYPQVGRFFGFTAARITPAPDGYVARLVQDLHPDWPPERRFPIRCGWLDGFVLTAVVLPPADA